MIESCSDVGVNSLTSHTVGIRSVSGQMIGRWAGENKLAFTT